MLEKGRGWRRMDEKFYGKFDLSGIPYTVIVTDLGRVFRCCVDGGGFEDERKMYFPGEGTVDDEDVLLEMEALVTRSEAVISEEGSILEVKFEDCVDGVFFEWRFRLERVDVHDAAEVLREEWIRPMVRSATALSRQREALLDIIVKKDREIAAFKQEMEKSGLRPLRRSLVTKAFDRDQFLRPWVKAEELTEEMKNLMAGEQDDSRQDITLLASPAKRKRSS